jgi:hypothetical protein
MLRILVLVGVALILATPSTGSAAPPGPTRAELQAEISGLKARLTTEEKVREVQTANSDNTLSMVGVIIAIAAVVITVVGVGLTFAGYSWVQSYAEKNFTETLQKQAEPVIAAGVSELRAKYDTQLAELFDQYERARQSSRE